MRSQRRASGRVPLRSVALGAVLLGLAGCGGSSAPAAPATSTAAADAGPGSASAGTTTPTGSPSGTPSAPGSTAAPPGTASVAVASAAAAYRVAYREVHEGVPGGPVDVQTLAVTVSGPQPAVQTSAQRAIAGLVARFRADFAANSSGETPAPGRPFSQMITMDEESRWGWLYSVQLSDYVDLNGAHPVVNVGAITIDLRTGREVLPTDLFAQLAPVDRKVRAALVATGVPADDVAAITIAHLPESEVATPVASYPGPKGLRVTLSQCVTACALGEPTVLLPWTTLPAPRARALPSSG